MSLSWRIWPAEPKALADDWSPATRKVGDRCSCVFDFLTGVWGSQSLAKGGPKSIELEPPGTQRWLGDLWRFPNKRMLAWCLTCLAFAIRQESTQPTPDFPGRSRSERTNPTTVAGPSDALLGADSNGRGAKPRTSALCIGAKAFAKAGGVSSASLEILLALAWVFNLLTNLTFFQIKRWVDVD